MAHTTRNKKKLLGRVRRIKGQVEAVERALESEADCASVLQLIASTRGAIGSLMNQVMEEHVLVHLVDSSRGRKGGNAAEVREFIEVLRTCIK